MRVGARIVIPFKLKRAGGVTSTRFGWLERNQSASARDSLWRTSEPRSQKIDVLGDVGRVVAGALEVARDDDGVQRLAADQRMLLHHLDQFRLDGAVHLVDSSSMVSTVSASGLGFEQRLDGGADHDADLARPSP